MLPIAQQFLVHMVWSTSLRGPGTALPVAVSSMGLSPGLISTRIQQGPRPGPTSMWVSASRPRRPRKRVLGNQAPLIQSTQCCAPMVHMSPIGSAQKEVMASGQSARPIFQRCAPTKSAMGVRTTVAESIAIVLAENAHARRIPETPLRQSQQQHQQQQRPQRRARQ